ncbi:MAG: hypothetical protein DWQ02_12780 [Bacteroidetes bacterium]|nr:MAG: hypothetical protein DWQ02_12780 [Bacteroidota bacterium]
MDPVFKKLNYKDQADICVLNAPESFSTNMKAMEPYAGLHSDLNEMKQLYFFMAFVQTQKEVDDLAPQVAQKLEGDGVVWFCYPKKSSKKYSAEISRDNGWAALGKLGFEGVRAVAIDEDWSALRFRKVEYIKTMKRAKSFAMTKEGKKKTTDRK